MFKTILLIAIILFAGALNSEIYNAAAQEMVSAKVLSIEGPVEIRRQPGGQAQMQTIAFKVEDKLQAGDTIVTGKKGRLVLGLSDGSQAVIAPQTTVVIKDLTQSPRTLFNVIRGKTRIQIEKLGGQPNPYRVNTPTAVIAVRGTIFDVLVKDDETEVFLHEGEVQVINLISPDRPVTLFAGQMTRVMRQGAPRPPSDFKSGRNDGNFRPMRRESSIQRDSGIDRGKDGRIADVRNNRPDGMRDPRQPNERSRPEFERGGAGRSGGRQRQ